MQCCNTWFFNIHFPSPMFPVSLPLSPLDFIYNQIRHRYNLLFFFGVWYGPFLFVLGDLILACCSWHLLQSYRAGFKPCPTVCWAWAHLLSVFGLLRLIFVLRATFVVADFFSFHTFSYHFFSHTHGFRVQVICFRQFISFGNSI